MRTDKVHEHALDEDNGVEGGAVREEGRRDPNNKATEEDREEKLRDPKLPRTQLLHSARAIRL